MMNKFQKELLKELLVQRKRLDEAIRALRNLSLSAPSTRKAKRRLRRMSAEARRKISRAQKARWAKLKKAAR
jgi:hypothetical protein